MSLNGEINSISGGIKRAIEKIARSSMTDHRGVIYGTKKIFGYVCAIHEDGELAGTIDVQEFNYEPDEYTVMGSGHHKGVLLSAIQDNTDGFLVVPMLYSEVVITESPLDGNEYVLMYSHAQRIGMVTRSVEDKKNGEVTIGVTEVEKFVETSNGLKKDYDELTPTNNKTLTRYTSESITDTVTSKSDTKGLVEEKTAKSKTITVGSTKITVQGDTIIIETDKANIKAKNCEINGGTVTITGGTLKTKGMSNTDLNGPFNSIKVCPFSGAPHCGSSVSGT